MHFSQGPSRDTLWLGWTIPPDETRSLLQIDSHRSGTFSRSTRRIARNVLAVCGPSVRTWRINRPCHLAGSGISAGSSGWHTGSPPEFQTRGVLHALTMPDQDELHITRWRALSLRLLVHRDIPRKWYQKIPMPGDSICSLTHVVWTGSCARRTSRSS